MTIRTGKSDRPIFRHLALMVLLLLPWILSTGCEIQSYPDYIRGDLYDLAQYFPFVSLGPNLWHLSKLVIGPCAAAVEVRVLTAGMVDDGLWCEVDGAGKWVDANQNLAETLPEKTLITRLDPGQTATIKVWNGNQGVRSGATGILVVLY